MPDTVLVTGMTWATGEPALRVRLDGSPSVLIPLTEVPSPGASLNYRAGPGSTRICVGHRPFRNTSVPWTDCDNPPLHDGAKCDRCAAVDATFASQLHHAHNRSHGELDAAVRAHLNQPNELYLAAFRDGSVKVGTSTAARLTQRLLEQGAWRARIVAHAADGVSVRQLEERITFDLGLPQSVSIRRKLDGLARPRRDDQLDAELDLWRGSVHELLAELDDERFETADAPWRFDDHRSGGDAEWPRLHPYPLKLDSGAHDLDLRTASGRAVVFDRPGSDDLFVADIRSLFGVVLELGEHEPEPVSVQDTLFQI